MKKSYTRAEKIKFYQRKVLNLEYALEKAQDRLHYIMSDEYQDWTNSLQMQLNDKKKKRSG